MLRFTVAAFLTVTATSVFADDTRMSLSGNPGGSDLIDVIVQYRQTPTEANHNRILAKGGQLRHNFDIIRGAHYLIPASQFEQLASDPDIAHVSLDHAVKSTATVLPSTPDYGWMTVLGLTSPTATLPWDGTGIGVAVI